MSFSKLGPLRTSTRFGRFRRAVFGRNSRERFHDEVLGAFDFMFKEHGSRVVSWGEDRWNGLDSAVVETVADRMRISFERDRGEYMIRIGPEAGTLQTARISTQLSARLIHSFDGTLGQRAHSQHWLRFCNQGGRI